MVCHDIAWAVARYGMTRHGMVWVGVGMVWYGPNGMVAERYQEGLVTKEEGRWRHISGLLLRRGGIGNLTGWEAGITIGAGACAKRRVGWI
jgi:hypothetical protein